ncbi:MAG TPA: hypothetical protein VFQ13_19765 [Anaerolineales bacterium]|nr:hypothetical protein [Anaerolineales bacterium]
MNSIFKRFIEKPIFILLAINILVGLFVFRDYGSSWDEPLFYDYGDALGYAYSPREWFSGDFDVSRSYGSSGDDHKTRGPAYLFVAREPVYLLQAIGLDPASAWHLVNFLFFQLGVYFLYRLAARWMRSSAALTAAALFSWQPLLWGHAFINPKDAPFLVFFLASVCLGFEMVNRLTDESKTNKQKVVSLVFAAVFLGITTSIRVLGPLAGSLVLIYFLAAVLPNEKLRGARGPWLFFLIYGVVAILVMFITWPFLWENPIPHFIKVFLLMSDNPTDLSVLFGGQVYRAGELPRRYLPFMLVTTLTEPVWFLFFFGTVVGYIRLVRQKLTNHIVSVTLVLLWFFILIAYVLLRKPAMYDGLRHFLFILPPVFIFIGFAFEFVIDSAILIWLRAGLVAVLLLPGIAGILQLHPYEYTYYNSFVGGTSQVFRQYETDYWLTCYKEAVENLNQVSDQPINLYIHREAYIAAYYADENINVHDLRGALAEVKPGDYVLVNTRTNEDRRVFKDAPPVLQVGRGDAIFCMVKQIP